MKYYFLIENGLNIRIEPIEKDYIPVQKFGLAKVYVVSETRLYEMFRAFDLAGILNLN